MARAGPRQNGKIAEQADVLVAFRNGDSNGTAGMTGQAREASLLVPVFYLDNAITRQAIPQESTPNSTLPLWVRQEPPNTEYPARSFSTPTSPDRECEKQLFACDTPFVETHSPGPSSK